MSVMGFLSRCSAAGTILVLRTALAADADVIEGEKLYVAQCQICHGMTAENASMQHPARTLLARHDAAQVSDAPGALAFAPPFGPNLRGVYMRPAGSQQDFQYSPAFLKALKDMPWNDAALDVWITNTQAWVPGVYMFYKQPDADIRRKIISYLKANP